MRLGGRARWLAEANTEESVRELVDWARSQNVAYLMIGQGSNIVWRDEGFKGLIIVNRITGREVLEGNELSTLIRVGGGENWDEVVAWSVEKGWSGIEFLSRIPGTAGAAPVQNIGAYGAEIAQTLVSVGVFDSKTDAFETILGQSCGFSYRTSRFKTTDKGRFMILSVTLRLNKKLPTPPFYESLTKYFEEHHITEFTPATIRQAVTAIRAIKLPDPSVVANNGSFFTNPIIEQSQLDQLKEHHPDLKGWPLTDGRVKLSAGWLVEKAGFKNIHDPQTGMATWPHSALVVINEHAQRTADLLAFKQKIVSKVQQLFGISLEQEPELLP